VAHVYLVDDDATLRQLLARRVQQAGHRVTAVGSSAEALDAVRQTGPARRRRARRQNAGNDDVSAARALDAMYLTKPFAAVELLTLLEERLRGRALTG
jgi:DNA-binding response OmpR family regulator